MMNKPPMGAQPAPSGPPTLNFQSDPNMRSQFKGFMSGMAARNMPAPQPQPVMMMPSMPQQMAMTDIFQPVQNFAVGGAALPGDPRGGFGPATTSRISDMGSTGPRSYSAEEAARNIGYTFSDPTLNPGGDNIQQIINPTARPAITRLYDQGIAALQNLFNDRDDADRIAAADANMGTGEADALQEQITRMRQNQAAANQAARNAEMQNAANTIQSVIQGNAADAIANADTNLLDADIIGFEDDDRLNQRLAAEEITRRGGVVDVDPVTGQVTAQVTGPTPRPTGPQFDNLGAMGAGSFPSPIPAPAPRPSTLIDFDDPTQVPITPSATPSRDLSLASPYDMVSIGAPTGYDEVGTQVPAPAPAPSTMALTTNRADDRTGDLKKEMVTRGLGAGSDPMEQLKTRADKGGFFNEAKGIYERIMEGGTAVYDRNNQIVGVYTQGGPFGSTTYFGRSGYGSGDSPTARQISLQNESSLPEGVSDSIRRITDPNYDFGDDDDAANFFLRRLVQGNLFEKGGEVPTPFRNGGGVGRQDYEGASISGVSGNVAGSTTSDVGSSQSMGQQASGQSFSGADLYGDDDINTVSTQTVTATPMPETQTVTATPMPQPETEVTTTPTTTPQPQANTIQVTNPLTGDVISVARPETTVMEQAGNLLGDLFSVPGDLLSNLGPTDAEIAAQVEANLKAVRDRATIDRAILGEEGYQQKLMSEVEQLLTPEQRQAYSQAGVNVAPAPAATLQRGVSGGQRVNVPVAAQYERYNPTAAGIQKGVQMKGELIGLGSRFN